MEFRYDDLGKSMKQTIFKVKTWKGTIPRKKSTISNRSLQSRTFNS